MFRGHDHLRKFFKKWHIIKCSFIYICLLYTLIKERKNSSDTNIPNKHKTHTPQELNNYIHDYLTHKFILYSHSHTIKKHDIH